MSKKIMLASLLAASQMATAGNNIQWLNAPNVQPLQSMNQSKSVAASTHQMKPVQYNISLIGQDVKAAVNKGFVAESKSFYMDVTAQQLNNGIDLPVASESAVIRISALNETTTIAVGQLELSQGKEAISKEIMATGTQLKSLGMNVSENTLAMKINHQPGTLRLRLKQASFNQKAMKQDEQFVIHVLEPQSPYRLAMTTEKQLYQAGESLKVKAELLTESGQMPVSMQGYVSKPNGEKFADLTFKADSTGQMVAALSNLPLHSLSQGLWEVHTIAKSDIAGQTVLRDVSSAFAVTVPTAQFNGQLNLTKSEIKLGINNNMTSRYEANGVLYGHDKAGVAQPIAMLMTADWLSTGQSTLNFELPKGLIKSSGLSAPFLVKDVNLKNQSLMAPVQNIAGGFQFDY